MPTINLTVEEARVVEAHREKAKWLAGFNAGIDAACRAIINLAEQGCGGTGALDERDRMILAALRRIDPEKGY